MIFPLVGNLKINQSVTNIVKEKRLPHAVIIEGDKGLGKHTLARFLSFAAVCEGEDIPCGNCRGCNMAKSGNHPDISVIAPEDGKKNIAVAQIRALRDEAYFKPHMAKYRVFVIDSAHTMNEQSQNALLKVLEEPPANVMFILIAENASALLETIISRCVCLTLGTVEKQTAAEYIKTVANFSEADIDLALDDAQNNIGKALMLLEGKTDSQMLTAASEFLSAFLAHDVFMMLKSTVTAEKSRVEADAFFKNLKYITASRLSKNPTGFEAKHLVKLYGKLCEFEESLALNINLSLLMSALTTGATEIFNNK
jgi:DNA polymerase-3 subunit delta'